MDTSGFAQSLIVAIKEAPRRSAPGPSGWRYEHLKAIISDRQELTPVLGILTKILLAQIPPEIRDILRTTWLIGAAKYISSSIRPISLSDVLRRVVAKAIALKYKCSWKQAVGIHQFGVATSAGVEAVQSGVQLFLQSNPNSAAFIADGANAFNSCNRQHFLNQLYIKHPELSAFVEQWYGGEAPLWFAMDNGSIATVISSEGAQQGDPHGSFLFCLGATPILEEISQALPQSFIGAIIDDITITAPIDIMPRVISTTARSLLKNGIHLALPKCLIFAPPHTLPLLPEDTDPLIPRSDSGFKLLGSPLVEARRYDDTLVPLGNANFMESWLHDFLQKLKVYIGKISLIKHTQSAFQILLLSANNKIGHLLRSTSSSHDCFSSFIQQFDDCILQGFKSIVGCPILSPPQISQLRLPERMSGLGLLSAAQMAPAAFLGSARVSLFELSQRDFPATFCNNLYLNNQLNPDLPWVACLQHNWGLYSINSTVDQAPPSVSQWSSENFLALPTHRPQHKLFNNVVKAAQQKLISSVSPVDQIRLHSCSATGAGAFLRASANSQGPFFSNKEFQVAIKLRIRAPLSLLCPPLCICGEPIDDFGDHFLKCRVGGEWSHRHSALVHLIASIYRSVQLTVQHEVPLQNLGPLISADSNGNGRMDLVVTSSDSTSLLADVTITHPSPSNQTISQQMLLPLFFAKKAEDRKVRRYGAASRAMNLAFLPMALETFGACGPGLDRELKSLARRIACFNDWHQGTEVSYISTLIRFWRTRISSCLQKCNAKLILSKAHRARSLCRQSSHPNFPDVSSSWCIR
jgi:hypothetical protein